MQHAIDLGLGGGVAAGVELVDQPAHVPAAVPGDVRRDVPVDRPLRRQHRPTRPTAGGTMKIVQVVQMHARRRPGGRLDVPRHGQIQQEQGPILPISDGRRDGFGRHDRPAAARAARHKIGVSQQRRQVVERPALPAELRGEPRCATCVATGDDQSRRPLCRRPGVQVLEQKPRDLARPDAQHRLAAESVQGFVGIFEARLGNTRAGRVEPAGRADVTSDTHRPLEDAVQDPPRLLTIAGQLVGPADLAQHLRLAGDHGVERRRHAEQVPHGRLASVVVQVRREPGRVEFAMLTKRGEGGVGVGRGRAGQVELNAVARRQQDRPLAPGGLAHGRERRRRRLRRYRQRLTHLDRSRRVI